MRGLFLFDQMHIKRITYILIAVIGSLMQFILFKMEYPSPNFRGDSAAYISAAIAGADATEWPVGYSKFLAVIHFFSHSDTFLVCIQFLMLEVSGVVFLVTVKYLINPGRVVFDVLFIFLIFNPLFLHLGNYIMSDGLFISLSLLWFSQLIWIIYRPSAFQVVLHAMLLAALFTVRYNALYYPIISLITFILSSQRIFMKIGGIAVGFILITLFVIHTERKFEDLNGMRQFSPFGGWQIANNALYMYSNMQLADDDHVPEQFHELDSFVRKSFLMAKREGLVLDPYVKDYYIWHSDGPLGGYLSLKWRSDSITDMFAKWVAMGPLYSAYGSYLVRKYPIYYFKYFIFPNINNFFSPEIADLAYYNQGWDRIYDLDAIWFDYKSSKIIYPSKNYEIKVLKPYPTIIKIFNIVFLLACVLYLLLDAFKQQSKKFNHVFILTLSFWLLNFLFSTAASSVELRYQVFQFVLCFSFTMILAEKIFRSRAAIWIGAYGKD
jgi:hypothetical protein